MKKTCKIEGCEKDHTARGFCKNHYYLWKRTGNPIRSKTEDGAPMKFMEMAKGVISDECLIWPFARNIQGYGNFRGRGAHRVVCELANGVPPTPDHEAAHNCGNGHLGCVTGSHLEWKTRAENMKDKIKHGTSGNGEKNSMAKLTKTDVLFIRKNYSKLPLDNLAERFGVHKTNISAVARRKSWAWL